MPDVGSGLAITFDSGFFAEGMDFQHTSIERAVIDASNWSSSGAMEFIAGDLYDPGELVVELHHDPSTLPPIGSAAETVTVTYPDTGAAAWAATGFMSAYEVRGQFEDRIVATATIKLSGVITVTP